LSDALIDAGSEGVPFGLDSDLDGDLRNVSPFRPTGTFGAAAREDVEVHPVRFPPLTEPVHLSSERRALDLIMDVTMRVTVELGRASLTGEDVLGLGPGSVVELNKLAGEPVDVMVNDQLIARGEVVVVDENFGVRVTEIVSPRSRAQAMGA
jgi:flagellar motor switch protein FliN/FliY